MDMLQKIKENGDDPKSTVHVIDLDSSARFASLAPKEISPCLTRARGLSMGFYITKFNRVMTIDDMQTLQGFPQTMKRIPATGHQFAGMLGNAMCVPVLREIIRQQLLCTGFLST